MSAPRARILVVDDEPGLQNTVRRILSRNHEVSVASSGPEALAILAHTPHDLAIVDVRMPGMNGFAALRALRRDPDTKDIPIIMISGNEQATEEFYVHRIGADDFMKKPFSRGEVFARIERLLDGEGVPRRVPAAEAAGETAAATPA